METHRTEHIRDLSHYCCSVTMSNENEFIHYLIDTLRFLITDWMHGSVVIVYLWWWVFGLFLLYKVSDYYHMMNFPLRPVESFIR